MTSAAHVSQIFSGYLTEAQEINTEFARRATETWIEAFRKQTELNQRMVQRLYGEAEGQRRLSGSECRTGCAVLGAVLQPLRHGEPVYQG